MSYLSFNLSLCLRHIRLSLTGGSAKGRHVPFFQLALQQATACEQRLQFSTAKNYRTAIRSLQAFVSKDDLPLSDITAERMSDYCQWLRRKGVSLNTQSCYIRALRSIYNKVVKQYGLEDAKPFEKLFTGQVKTVKRSLSDADIRRLQSFRLEEGSSLSLSRDVFLFCLYAQGMPFVDAAFLQRNQIKDDILSYERHKTGQRIVVKMEPCLKAIVDRYAQTGSGYVFPIITATDPALAYSQYQSRLRAYNRALHRLEKLARLGGSLTSYVVRHTWASMAYDTDVDLAVISSALGHTNSETTRIYIRDINNRRVAEANHRVLGRLKV
jgi:integrase/recombinase XerD